MIISNKHKVMLLSPPKTGTRARIKYYQDINDVFTMHVRISDLDKLCEREELLSKEDYFKYAFVRNPWRRIASLHNMGFQIKPNTIEEQREADFNEWMHSKYFQKVIPMADFVLDHENNIAVDKIFKVEKWEENINELNLRFGYIPKHDISHTPKYNYQNTYFEYYKNNQKLIDLVLNKESNILKIVSYEFSVS